MRSKTIAAVSTLRTSDRLALPGALVLIPENLNHLARIESLAHCAVNTTTNGNRAITRNFANKLLNEYLLEWVGSHDDPCGTMATEGFTHHGGTFTFVAPAFDKLFALRALAAIIASSKELPSAFKDNVASLIQGVCLLSDRIASRAGLIRNLPMPDFKTNVAIPPAASFEDFLDTVVLKSYDIETLLHQSTMRVSDLDAICTCAADSLLPEPPHASEMLQITPLVRVDDKIIVIAPHCLLDALLSSIIRLAAEEGVGRLLAEQFHGEAFFTVDYQLSLFGLRLASGGLSSRLKLQDSVVTHTIYQCDHDKIVHVALVSDALHSESTKLASTWISGEVEEELDAARDVVKKLLLTSDPPIHEWLSLVVFCGLGRDCAFAVRKPRDDEPDLIVLLGSDIETILLSDKAHGSPLLLWRFAHARRQFEIYGQIVAWTPLDAFACWRENRYKFPACVSSQQLLVADSTLGRTLRTRAVVEYDWHAIPSRNSDRLVEVGLFAGANRQIFAPKRSSAKRIELAVALGNWVVWVVSSDSLEKSTEPRSAWFEVARMIVYWIDTVFSHLDSQLPRCDGSSSVLLVTFELVNTSEETCRDIGYTFEVNDGVQIRMHPSLVEHYDNTNAYERKLVAELTRALLLAMGMTEGQAGSTMEGVIDLAAPLGVKRMLHGIHTGRFPAFIGASNLPRARYPHSADLVAVRRQTVVGMPPYSEASVGQRPGVWLNRAVENNYQHLLGQISPLDSRRLLRRLLENNEALVVEDVHRDLTLPSQLACWGPENDTNKRLLEDIPRHASASLATRFLIELVTAEPPTGTGNVSDFTLDNLLATALEIIECGMASDIDYYQLAQVQLHDNYGDLSILCGTYDDAAQGAVFDYTSSQIERETARVELRFLRGGNSDESSGVEIRRLDDACHVEFGATLSTIVKALVEAVALAQAKSDSLVEIPRHELTKQIAKQLELEFEAVDAFLNRLVLPRRGTYLDPPLGFSRSDILPWRYNRGLSYIRRPFILVRDAAGIDQLWYTPGHVHRASANLTALITTGRLKARSSELKKVMGKYAKAASDSFNREVADLLRQRGLIQLVNHRLRRCDSVGLCRPVVRRIGLLDSPAIGDGSFHANLTVRAKGNRYARMGKFIARPMVLQISCSLRTKVQKAINIRAVA